MGQIPRASAQRRMASKLSISVSNTHDGLEVIAEQRLITASAQVGHSKAWPDLPTKSIETTFPDVFACSENNVDFGLAWEHLLMAKGLG